MFRAVFVLLESSRLLPLQRSIPSLFFALDWRLTRSKQTNNIQRTNNTPRLANKVDPELVDKTKETLYSGWSSVKSWGSTLVNKIGEGLDLDRADEDDGGLGLGDHFPRPEEIEAEKARQRERGFFGGSGRASNGGSNGGAVGRGMRGSGSSNNGNTSSSEGERSTGSFSSAQGSSLGGIGGSQLQQQQRQSTQSARGNKKGLVVNKKKVANSAAKKGVGAKGTNIDNDDAWISGMDNLSVGKEGSTVASAPMSKSLNSWLDDDDDDDDDDFGGPVPAPAAKAKTQTQAAAAAAATTKSPSAGALKSTGGSTLPINKKAATAATATGAAATGDDFFGSFGV